MRYLILKNDSIHQYFSKVGIKIKPAFEKRINLHNTVIIDETFEFDITIGFLNYIFEVYKILTSHRRDKIEKIFNLNYDLIYNKPINENFAEDLIILLKKYNFKKINIPYIDRTGKIRLTLASYSDNIVKTIKFNRHANEYIKLRTIIFNTTILPYIKTLIF